MYYQLFFTDMMTARSLKKSREKISVNMALGKTQQIIAWEKFLQLSDCMKKNFEYINQIFRTSGERPVTKCTPGLQTTLEGI